MRGRLSSSDTTNTDSMDHSSARPRMPVVVNNVSGNPT